MYTHCPHCTASLGTNEVLEDFPVGERLAYDLDRGRLWALCSRCRTWNLAPIHERWEAVEALERLFETAHVGARTERMALGRLADGTEVVRVGGAEEGELAGWRYARRLETRARRVRRTGWVTGGAAFAVVSLPLSTALVAPFFFTALGGSAAYQLWKRARTRLEVPRDTGDPLILSVGDLSGLRLVPADAVAGETPGLSAVPSPLVEEGRPPPEWRLELHRWGYRPLVLPESVQGRAMRLALAEANREVGKPRQVNRALDRVLELGRPDRVIAEAARTLHEGRAWETTLSGAFGPRHRIRSADPVLRLALEIAANEELEVRALEGELHLLEKEWKEAEEIAAIADDLLLPRGLLRRLRQMKREAGRGE